MRTPLWPAAPATALVVLLLLAPVMYTFSPGLVLEGVRLAVERPGSLSPVANTPAVEVLKAGGRYTVVLRGPSLGAIPGSLVLALVVSSAATLLGFLAALAALLYRKLSRVAIVLAVVSLLPYPFVEAYVVRRLVDPENGLVNLALRPLGVGLVVQGVAGVALYQVLVFTPIAFIILYGYMSGISREAVESALQLGAAGARLAWLVARLSSPAIAASAAVTAVLSLDDVAGPLVFQMDSGARSLLAYRAYSYFMESVTGTVSPTALGYSVILLSVSLAVFLAGYPFIAKTYRGLQPASRNAGILPRLGLRGAWAVAALAVSLGAPALVKLLAIAYGFSGNWVASPIPSIGFDSFRALFEMPDLVRGVLNSLFYTAVSLAVSLVLALPASHVLARRAGRLAALADAVVNIPVAVPGIVLAYAYYVVFHSLFAGTLLDPITGPWIYLVAGYTVRRLTLLYKAAQALVASIPVELEEAAAALGAGVGRVERAIIAPIAIQRLQPAIVFTALSIATEVSLSITIGGLAGSSGFTHPAPLMYLVAGYMSYGGLAYAGVLALATTILHAGVVVLALLEARLALIILRKSYR
ncbi:hypothetical protein [Pyrodictium abyssi]|uniref:Iron ABC transporter permease n=1 Tax=Pyrodictium abyssi TaxID=54256 RepID=A0ABN6ZUP3_9CREN|nr:iron ABC transporter permease [Pyrodictium abyssi]